jgi:hypothetical protein
MVSVFTIKPRVKRSEHRSLLGSVNASPISKAIVVWNARLSFGLP